MAVFRQELNWSTYQDEQLKVLRSLDASFKSSLNMSKDINRNIGTSSAILNHADATLLSMTKLLDKMDQALSALTTHFVKDFKAEASKMTVELEKSRVSFSNNAAAADSLTRSFNQNTEANNRNENSIRKSTITTESFNKVVGKVSAAFERLGREATNYSNVSNQLITMTGLGGDAVKEFRSDLMSIVDNLNQSTGGFYNPQESYKQLASISQGVTGNLEALKEMSRPLLLANETLDINLSSIGNLFNRFYVRYNFSSRAMEEVVGDIRKYSAGSHATGEEIAQAQENLKTLVEYYAQGNEDKLVAYNENLAQMVGYYENSGLGSSQIQGLLDNIYKLEGGEFTGESSQMRIFEAAGWSAQKVIDASKDPSQWKSLSDAYLSGVTSIFGNVEDSNVRDRQLAEYGLDPKEAMEIYNYTKNRDLAGDFNKYLNTRTDTSLEELVEDKYISQGEKITNTWLEKIYKVAADIQEFTGVGFTDVASLLTGIAAILAFMRTGGFGGAGGTARSLLGSFSSGGRATAGLLGSLEMGGFNLSGGSLVGGSATALGLAGGLGALGGAAGTLYGIGTGISDIKSGDTGHGIANIAGGAAMGVGAGALTAGLLGVGATNIWNPIGWTALAVGGLTLLLTKASKEVNNNASVVQDSLDSIGNSFKKENQQRLKDISTLSYQFDQESDINNKRKLLEESGLFDREELNNTADDQLKKLVDSYKSAASAMDSVTNGVLTLADKYYTEQQDTQQGEFIESLRGSNLSGDQRKDIISLLQTGITDEKLQNKFEKYLKDDSISKKEFNDLLYGGKNSLFDKHNLKDQAINVSSMQAVSGYLGLDQEFNTTENMEKVVSLYQKFATAMSDNDRKAAYQEIIDSGLEDEVRSVYGRQLKAYGYAKGTNYIPYTQVAILHEGEAVVPKKYNPTANIDELKMLRDYYMNNKDSSEKDSSEYLRVSASVLNDIKDFLAEWKEDSIRRNTISEVKSRFSSNTSFVSKYLPG